MNLHSALRPAALVVCLSAALWNTSVLSAVVCGPTANFPLTVPQTANGVHINVVTGAISVSGTVGGWDFRAYDAGGLAFQSSTDPANTTAYWGGNSADTTPFVLAATVFTVGPASSFPFVGANTSTGWRGGADGYIGVRFTNEATGAPNYGWVRMTSTSLNGFPAVVLGYCYENTGGDIVVGATPVALQAFSVD